ncbi:hypothetical protein NLI96_g6672 [Meripilus lineatus]|uniref:Amino acid permease/ SLC12A domain-containing protein n=1 Tax=Meripilus lineatus TaxID=2056292 RepID=A0AAD5V0H1_9APHY|nr:hypothetical protein NLI96_g6672 [Physisporinus lineatus]
MPSEEEDALIEQGQLDTLLADLGNILAISSCPVGVLNIPLPLTVPLTLGQSPTQRTSHLSLSLSRLPRRKNKSQPSALCSFPFMSTLPSLSRKPSYSSDPEEKDGGYIDPKELNDIELARMPHPTSHKPLWKRMLTGDAHYAFDTHRAMSSRHITMIAIGGTIGTGIFLSAGSSLYAPLPDPSLRWEHAISTYTWSTEAKWRHTFLSPERLLPSRPGLCLLQWVSPLAGIIGYSASELTAAAIILQVRVLGQFPKIYTLLSNEIDTDCVVIAGTQYWTIRLQPWEWALIIIVPIFAIQLIHVRWYGESEYWFALIKVLMVIVFIIVGLIYDWGGVHGHPGPGLSNFHNGQAFIGGFSAFTQTFVWAFYSYGGVELVTLAAGESKRPHKTIPRAIKATFFRVILFYVLTILTIGLNINHSDETLLYAANSSDVTASPLTVVFVRAGFGAAAHVVNAVLLTAVLSATNSCFYASSRMLLSLARNGHAPRVFGWVNQRGVPVPALLVSLAMSCLAFLTTIWGEGVVFTWFLNLVGISALLVWASIGCISIRFRYAWSIQGRSLRDLPFVQPLFPLLPVVTIVLALLMFAGEGYAAVVTAPFDWRNVVATYVGVLVYAVLYIGYTLYSKYYLKSPCHFVPLSQVDLDTGAVWKRGEGDSFRQREKEMVEKREQEEGTAHGLRHWWRRTRKHVY